MLFDHRLGQRDNERGHVPIKQNGRTSELPAIHGQFAAVWEIRSSVGYASSKMGALLVRLWNYRQHEHRRALRVMKNSVRGGNKPAREFDVFAGVQIAIEPGEIATRDFEP